MLRINPDNSSGTCIRDLLKRYPTKLHYTVLQGYGQLFGSGIPIGCQFSYAPFFRLPVSHVQFVMQEMSSMAS
jgi:hypothetical protein